MNSRIVLFLVCFLSVSATNAQVFYDNFVNNSNNWTTYSKSNATIRYNNGMYIDQRHNDINAYVTKSFRSVVGVVKEVECAIKKFEGATGVGLVWNFKDEKTHNRFIITTRDNQFFIQYRVNGNKQIKKSWTSNTAINSGDGTNVFKLKQKGSYVDFYINGTLLHSQSNSNLSKDKIGILLGCSPGARCKIEYFKVTGKSSQTINTPPDIAIINPVLSRGFKVIESKLLFVSGKVTDPDGIYKVTINGQRVSHSGGSFSSNVSVPLGRSTVVITATDNKMKIARRSFDVERKTNQPPVVINIDKPNIVQKRLALVIGNGGYQHGGSLTNPVNDARAMKLALQQLGFTVLKYENCSQSSMKRAIDEFGAKLKNFDVGLVFYAGHGVQLDGRNYLIPVNAKLESKNDVEYDCVRAGRILGKMESAGTKTNIIILDACRNNPFERSWNRNAKGNGLAFMNAPSGSLIAYATSPGTTASDGSGSNGLYTSSLLRHINTPNITIEEVFKKVRQEVMQQSQGKQTPWESTSLVGEFFFGQ